MIGPRVMRLPINISAKNVDPNTPSPWPRFRRSGGAEEARRGKASARRDLAVERHVTVRLWVKTP